MSYWSCWTLNLVSHLGFMLSLIDQPIHEIALGPWILNPFLQACRRAVSKMTFLRLATGHIGPVLIPSSPCNMAQAGCARIWLRLHAEAFSVLDCWCKVCFCPWFFYGEFIGNPDPNELKTGKCSINPVASTSGRHSSDFSGSGGGFNHAIGSTRTCMTWSISKPSGKCPSAGSVVVGKTQLVWSLGFLHLWPHILDAFGWFHSFSCELKLHSS